VDKLHKLLFSRKNRAPQAKQELAAAGNKK